MMCSARIARARRPNALEKTFHFRHPWPDANRQLMRDITCFVNPFLPAET
jgi:hypothetical protein